MKRILLAVLAFAILTALPVMAQNPCNPCGGKAMKASAHAVTVNPDHAGKGTIFHIADPMGRDSVTFRSEAPLEDIVGTSNQIRGYVALKGIPEAEMSDLLRHPQIVDLLERRVARVNERLAQYERIKKFRILDREFSLEEGEVTLTLKLRRKVIEERYRERIEEMYAGPGPEGGGRRSSASAR